MVVSFLVTYFSRDGDREELVGMVDVMASMFEFDRADIFKVDEAIDSYYRFSLSNTLGSALDTATSVASPLFSLLASPTRQAAAPAAGPRAIAQASHVPQTPPVLTPATPETPRAGSQMRSSRTPS